MTRNGKKSIHEWAASATENTLGKTKVELRTVGHNAVDEGWWRGDITAIWKNLGYDCRTEGLEDLYP